MILSLNETRVLGVLCEKQRTVPDSYPMTLNSLLSGCNQKTSRDPVLELTESDVLAAIDGLREHSLIIEQSGSRVARYAHNLERVLQIPTQSSAILTALILRGPQTAAELRTNCERLHKFADISALEAFLAELSERSAGALVIELPRQPGARKNRWMHLLSGEVDLSQFAAGSAVAAADPALKTRVEELEAEVATLKNQLAHLARELGVSLPE